MPFTQNAMARRAIWHVAILLVFMVILWGIDVPEGALSFSINKARTTRWHRTRRGSCCCGGAIPVNAVKIGRLCSHLRTLLNLRSFRNNLDMLCASWGGCSACVALFNHFSIVENDWPCLPTVDGTDASRERLWFQGGSHWFSSRC